MSDSILGDYNEPKKGKTVPLRRKMTEGRKAQLRQIANKTPEVLLKVSPNQITDSNGNAVAKSPRDKASLRGLVNYMGKDGNEVIDEQGNIFVGPDLKHATEFWAGLKETGGTKREAFHIVLSMKKGTPAKEFKIASEAFAKQYFEGHQYLIAHHNDTDQPHAHIALKVRSIDGLRRLNPRKADLQEWREGFAEQLNLVGIHAAATSRLDRLSTRVDLSQSEYRWAKAQGEDKLKSRQYKNFDGRHKNKIKERRKEIFELSNGSESDKQLAADLTSQLEKQLETLANFSSKQKSNERVL